MAKKKLLQDNEGQIWPITTADCVYLSDGSKTVKKYIDDALSGKADSSHGTHVTWSTTSPKVAGTAAVGSEAKAARGDHVHAAQTSVSGNAGTATKLKTARDITIGNKTNSFNGSANISFSLSDIGASSSDHGHNFIWTKGTNTIKSTTDDTTANWGAQENSVHWYTTTGQLIDQPNQWGYLVNIGTSNEVHQLWMTQSSGSILHRGGNSSGWNGSWRTLLDSSNYSSYALPLTGGSLSGRLGAWGKIGVPTTGGQWITGMDVANASIGVGTQQTTDSYHPVLGVMTAAGNIVNLGGINNDFGFYGYNYGRTTNGTDWQFYFDTVNKKIITNMSLCPTADIRAEGNTAYIGSVVLSHNNSLYGWNSAWNDTINIAGVDTNNHVYIGWGSETITDHRNSSYFHQPLFLTRESVGTMMMDMYTNPNRVEWIWYNSSSGDWDWGKKVYFDSNGQFYVGQQLSIGGHRITPYSENGVSIINPAGSEFSGLEVKELWIGPYSGATYKFVVSPSAPTASWGTVWVQI